MSGVPQLVSEPGGVLLLAAFERKHENAGLEDE